MSAPGVGERGAAYLGVHVLVDDDPRWAWDPVEQARRVCRGGPQVIQLRAKYASDAQTLAWARAICPLAHGCGARFVVNDRFDLALASGADGVHLGQEDLPPERVPEAIRKQLAVGRSTHDPEQIARARREPVDYLAFGPVFGTTSKSSVYGRRGIERLRAAARAAAPFPLVAIGGIDRETVSDVVEAGAGGVAVISAVVGAGDPEAATRALVGAMAEAMGA